MPRAAAQRQMHHHMQEVVFPQMTSQHAVPLQVACLAELLLPATQALYSSCVEFLAAHFEEVHRLGAAGELSLLPAAVMADVLGHTELAVQEQKVVSCLHS